MPRVLDLSKPGLAQQGIILITDFCDLNGIKAPAVLAMSDSEVKTFGGTCAYYRPSYIKLNVGACAAPGYGGRAWSWPSYVIDRTPYGVYAHELGHHVDVKLSKIRGRYRGDFSINLRATTLEQRITNYCPDDGEWFAEIFRLFVTNPDLLRRIRPKTYDMLSKILKPVTLGSWEEVLHRNGATDRIIGQARKKIIEVGGDL